MKYENRGYNDILKQLTIAVEKKYYPQPKNQEQQYAKCNKRRKRFVMASKTGLIRIGMFRTTQPYASGLEEIVAEDAVIIHENKGFNKPIRKQKIQCNMKELQDLKQAIEEIENNILQ